MKKYPKIPNSSKFIGRPCIAFYKHDGSNLRFEWSRKSGWNKSGTRNCLFNEKSDIYGQAISIFNDTYAEDLEKIFTNNKNYRKRERYTVFAEFFGPDSFAGLHGDDDIKELVLFDVWQYKFGLIGPRRFMRNFGHLKIPEIIYDGILNKSFINKVRTSVYNLEEGVVCKGGSGGKDIWMAKIKTNEYKEKLKNVYQKMWRIYWE